MSLFISSLNSGSNGNCYYVGNSTEAILVDAGLSCRETEMRMSRLGLSFASLKAIFISHEHGDHIKGVKAISKKYSLPVYITPKTLRSSQLALVEELIRPFSPHEPVQIGSISVLAFPKHHDAAHPHSFIVSSKGVTVGVFTDIGFACAEVIKQFKRCHAAFLEANYDEELLENGHYPQHLKKRIKSDKGHLSNVQALELFLRHKPPYMSHVLLSHLSKENNSAELVLDLFSKNAFGAKIYVASREEETEVFSIQGDQKLVQKFKKQSLPTEQLSLF